MKVMLEHAERTRAGSSPSIDGLERIAHGVDRAPFGVIHMEQCGKQCRLRGGGVLVFVEQHMTVATPRTLSDGGESLDELICRNGEIREFRHVLLAFGLCVGLDQLQQHFALARDFQQLCTMVGTARMQPLRPVVQLRLPIGVAVFFESLDVGSISGMSSFSRARRSASTKAESH